MEIPKDNTNFECVAEGLPAMLAAQRIVLRTLEAVRRCVPKKKLRPSLMDDDSEHPKCRPSFYIED
ncbi:hypothetical protein BGX34_008514 [Mortierella sp. NVP85]|nr:hypothetical protein BGX34_008514 [Mortierella sp. NVP85]